MDDIDERVAIEVMGWKRGHFCWVTDKGRHIDVTEWQPSKRIEQAWMVVEKLREEEFFVCIQGGDDVTRNSWWVAIADEEGSISAESDTAPMAICQAALEAKGYAKRTA